MLECENISIQLGKKQILEDCSLALKPGVLTAIIGPNGAGKSTLLKILSGVLKADDGEVQFAGKAVSAWSPIKLAIRRAVLSQFTTLTFDFKVMDVVLMGRQPHHFLQPRKRNHEIAQAALERVGMREFANGSYLTLSGGEKQRVQLARAICQIWEEPESDLYETRCLLLDEPLNNLDLQHQHHCMEITRELRDEGVAVLAVLHDLNLSFQYADRIVMMKNGRVLGECSQEHDVATCQLTELFNCDLKVGASPYSDSPHVFYHAVA